MRRLDWRSVAYIALLSAAFVTAVTASWRYGARLDNAAYDYIFQHYSPAPWSTHSVLLAIDERTLDAYGGMPGVRKPLAERLRIVAKAAPKAVAIDIILAYAAHPQADADLAAALDGT